MKISSMTDTGKVRRYNEDSIRSGFYSPEAVWAVVCDGMGGAAGGYKASSTAADVIEKKVKMCHRENMKLSSVQNMLLSAITTANVEVYDCSRENTELEGMGTTVVAAVVENGSCCIAHAGDSRAYLIGSDSIQQITKDHSLVQQMYDKGEISASEMKNHPVKNVITRALGVDERIEIDFNVEPFSYSQILLLCSDGLSNYVDESEMLALSQQSPFEDFAQKLVNAANRNGGGDNISVVAILCD